jgi:hypothetical protein
MGAKRLSPAIGKQLARKGIVFTNHKLQTYTQRRSFPAFPKDVALVRKMGPRKCEEFGGDRE